MTVSCPIHPLKNLLANTVSQKFLFLMTLTVLQNACWKFSVIFLNGGLSGVFLMFILGLASLVAQSVKNLPAVQETTGFGP